MAVSAALVKELRERTGLGMLDCKKALEAAHGNIDQAIEDLRKASGLKAAKKAGRTAAEGVIAARVSNAGDYAVLLEVNSETDFVARDENFLAFVNRVADKAFDDRVDGLEALMGDDLEQARLALVQKIGENVSVRRIASFAIDGGVIGSYVHNNNKIGVLVMLRGGNAELARDVSMHVAASNPQFLDPDSVPADVVAKEREIYEAQAAESGKPPEIVEKMVAGRIRKFLEEISLTKQPFVKDPDITVGDLLKRAGAEIDGFVRYEVGEGIEREQADFAAEVAAQLNK